MTRLFFILTIAALSLFCPGTMVSAEDSRPAETARTPSDGKSGDTTEPENDGDSDLDRILSGEEALPLVTAPELKAGIRRRFEDAEKWFNRQKDDLLLALFGSIGAILFGLGAGWLERKLLPFKAVTATHSLRRELARAVLPPLILLIVVLTIFGFLLPVLETLPELYRIDARIFFTTMTLIASWAVFRLLEVMSHRLCRYAQRNDNNLDILMVQITRKVLIVTLFTLTILFIGQSIFNLNITTLLAGAGVVGLAIAFASRETLSNFFGTLVIILDRPFRIGDRIQAGGIDGIVESVGMRSTRILTDSESLYTIPNSKMAECSIENISSRGYIRYAFTIGLVYETLPEKLEQAIRILHEITDDFHGKDEPDRTPRIFFENFGASALNFKVIMWFKTTSFETEEKWRTEINTQVFRRFNEAGLGIAYNTVTNYVKFDPETLPFPSEPAMPPRSSGDRKNLS